jgi:hypothetical protein
MAGQAKKNKDKEMAAYLKKKGVTRNTTQCPFHHGPVPLSTLSAHIQTCRGGLGRREYVRNARH